MTKLTQADLFSGIGGMLLAGQMAGFRPVLACEIQPFGRKVLRHHWPKLKIMEDVHDVSETTLQGALKGRNPDVLTGAYPFQTNYSRGERRQNDPRSLWDQFVRCAEALEPRWVLVETIPRLASLGFDDACWDLGRAGYASTAVHLPAQAFDCPLRKDRLFIVGSHRSSPGLPDPGEADGFDIGIERWAAPGDGVYRVAERPTNWMDWHVSALHAIGDATVPAMAAAILRGIAETERVRSRVGG